MDFANRGNRPNTAPQQSAPQQQEQSPQSFKPMNSEKKKRKLDFGKLTSGLLLIGTTVLVFALILGLVFGVGGQASESDLIQEDKYQAVFLDSQDGQVYFGKLDIYNEELYRLVDIYYVRVENPIQPEGANQPVQPNISLAKLGNELHGPQDAMFIRRDKVLYWENLKDDGQVVTAITEFKANGGQEAPANNQQQQQQTQQQTQPAGTPQQDDTAPADTTPDTTPTPDLDETPTTP
jgi:hypothetical protein